MKFLDYIQVNPTIKLEKDKQYPFVEMANADVFAREPKQIDIKKYSSGVKFQRGDTVIARIEPCLQNGKGFFVKNVSEGFGSTEFLVFRPKDDKVTNEFLYYFMLTDYIRKSMINSMTGATGRQRVNKDIFKSLELSLPSIEKQKRIADIFSAYDDLIENNQKQIKLLEEAAMRLYKEWFVNLRFPGYENSKIVDGVPEGWKLTRVKRMGQVITGKTPSTAIVENYGEDIPFVKIPDMHGVIYPLKTEVKLSERGANTQKNKFLPPKSIMVSCIATVGLVCITHEVCQTNQQINSIVLNDEDHLYYMFFKMKGIKSLLEGVGSNGATMTNVNKTKFENIELLKPENEILKKFNNLVEPFFSNILALSKQNEKLKEARDKLLSKLMSGEIEV
jgi:type I restriction enzyme S subunit